MSCPRCGEEMRLDPDGGYCPICEEYWHMNDLIEVWKELYDEDDDCDEGDLAEFFES